MQLKSCCNYFISKYPFWSATKSIFHQWSESALFCPYCVMHHIWATTRYTFHPFGDQKWYPSATHLYVYYTYRWHYKNRFSLSHSWMKAITGDWDCGFYAHSTLFPFLSSVMHFSLWSSLYFGGNTWNNSFSSFFELLKLFELIILVLHGP